MTRVVIPAPFKANPKQKEAYRHWVDPQCKLLLLAGAIRSSKTQAAGRMLVQTALEKPALYLVARMTYRELEDSTKRAMLHGDGSLPALIPQEHGIARYVAGDNKVVFHNGAEILFRSLEEHNAEKIRGLTLGGCLIDQVEELSPGDQGERLFDELLGRLSDPRGDGKMLLVANPTGTQHWLYRRYVQSQPVGVRYVHFTLTDNPALPADYVARMEATRESRPHWYRTFVLGLWGAIEHAAFPMFDETLHVLPDLSVPDGWERFEGMDFGSNNPTSWAVTAVDYDGNLVTFDEYYSPGLVSAHAAEIKQRRRSWEAKDDAGNRVPHPCYADPSIWNTTGLRNRIGQPASVASEFQDDHGIGLVKANRDRRAGYMRISELLQPDPARLFPAWHPRAGERGAPRWFMTRRCEHLVEQLQSAPLAVEDTDPERGEAVDRRWEGAHGHAVAMSRYMVMSRPGPSEEAPREPEDPRAALLFRLEQSYADPVRRREERERNELELV